MTARPVIAVLGLVAASAAPLRAQTPSLPRTTSCADSISPDTSVYTVDQLTEAPIVRSGSPLVVPMEVFRKRANLQVLLSLIIDPDGLVEPQSVVVVDSSRTAFDEAAVRMARSTVFWPGCRYAQAVRVRASFPVSYHHQ